MKHKFKPSVGGNRGKRAGGRREEQTPRGEKPSPAPTLDHQPGSELQLGECVASLAPETGPSTCNDSSQSRSGVVTENQMNQRDEGSSTGDGKEAESCGEVVESVGEKEQELNEPPQPTTKRTTTASVRLKKKIAPTVVSVRPRRSKQDSTHHNKPDGQLVSTSHINSSISPSTDVMSSHCSSTRTLSAMESFDRPVTHTSGQRNDFEEAESEGVALGEDVRTQVAQRESHSSAGDCNLSGVVRSSLDLVCPPPIRGEGATFEVSREEERPPQAVCTSSRESETQDSELIPEGGERDTEEISTVSTAGGDEQQNEPRMNSIPRSKKRQSCSDGAPSDTAIPAAKRKKTVAGISRSLNKIRKAPDRASMTMQELIYYNPSANPMSSSVEGKKKKSQLNEENMEPDNSSQQPSRAVTPATLASDASSEVSSDAWADSQESGRIVPQLRMGKDGSIVLDEESMVVETTIRPVTFDDPLNPPLIEGYGHTTSASYRKSNRVTRWSTEETSQFFRALSQVGTDFTMMTLLIPKRSRKELKNKFKKEEKSNPHRVARALKTQTSVRPTSEVTQGPETVGTVT